jgi:protein tyrosine/serine phosphatase
MKTAIIVILCLSAIGCQTPSPSSVGTVPQGLEQVSPGVWRSAQPMNADEWSYLKSLGIRHVVKLNFESEASDSGGIAAGFDVHVLSVQPEGDKDVFDNLANTFVRPDATKLAEAEHIIAAGGGVLVHCTHGQDRTGLVIGMHRVLHEHVTKADAYKEMLTHRFHPMLHGLHEFWEDFTATQ